MTEPATEKLTAIIDAIDEAFDAGRKAPAIFAMLEADHDASYKTDGNTNTLRCAGVTGTCSWSASDGVIASWRRNAQKRIEPGIGHNSRAVRNSGAESTDDRLRLLIERVERLEEEKKGIADDIKDVYGEARAVGYDAKIMRQIVALRKMKPDARAQMEAVLDVYKAALGLG